MNPDPEALFDRLTARGVSSQVRERILGAVAHELAVRPRLRWERWSGMSVAASLLIAIAANVWVSQRHQRQLAQLLGPPPVSRQVVEIAQAVESVTDAATAQWLQERVAMHRPRPTAEAYQRHLAQVWDYLERVTQDRAYEKVQKGSQDRSAGPWRDRDGLADHQRHPDPDHIQAA